MFGKIAGVVNFGLSGYLQVVLQCPALVVAGLGQGLVPAAAVEALVTVAGDYVEVDLVPGVAAGLDETEEAFQLLVAVVVREIAAFAHCRP